MAISPQDREEIKAVIAEAMRASNCACGLSPDAQSEVSHFMGMVKDLGNGDRGTGIEAMRDLLKWWAKLRTVGEKVGVGIIMALAVAVAGGLSTLVWLGFKEKLGK